MKYPKLTYMVHAIALDNGFSEKSVADWIWPVGSAALEGMAARLTRSERDTIAAGDADEVQPIIKRRRVQPLDDFCNMVFDGEFTSNFYKAMSSFERSQS